MNRFALTRGRGPLRADRRGQAVVEFALIAPILLLLVLGIVEFARAWSAHHVIADAAREGARWSAVANNSSDDEVRARVATALGNGGLRNNVVLGCPTSDGTPCVVVNSSEGGGGVSTGDPSEVYIEYPYQLVWIAPFLNWTTGESSITLKSRIVMRNE